VIRQRSSLRKLKKGEKRVNSGRQVIKRGQGEGSARVKEAMGRRGVRGETFREVVVLQGKRGR